MIRHVKKKNLKYRQIILYLFFGGATTVINTICYALLFELLHINNLISTFCAWVLSVIFAFVTNKIFVFKSHRNKMSGIIKEIVSFSGCRFLTGALDVGIMLITVSWLQRNSVMCKLLSNLLVIIINYFASKIFIFKNNSLKS